MEIYKPNRKVRMKALLLTAALLAAYFGVSIVSEVWQQRNIDATSHRQAVEHVTRPVPAHASQQQWRRVWTVPLGVSLTGAPAAWSNGWVATAENGRIAALDNRGRLLWNQTFSNVLFTGSPIVADATVVAAGRDGEVLAMERSTGHLLWRVKIDGDCFHGPLAIQRSGLWQVALLSSADGVIHLLDLKDGRMLHQSKETHESDGALGYDGQYLAYGNCDGAMHVFDPVDGEPVAQIQVGDSAVERERLTEMPSGVMAGGVLVCHGRIYGGTGGGELVCVDVAARNVAWRAAVAEREAFNTPVASHDFVMMGTRDGNIAAYAARNGTVQWQVALSNVVKTLCVVDDAVFTVAGGVLVGLRATDGRRFLKIPIGDDVAGPVWNGSVLVVAADGGNVIGFAHAFSFSPRPAAAATEQ